MIELDRNIDADSSWSIMHLTSSSSLLLIWSMTERISADIAVCSLPFLCLALTRSSIFASKKNDPSLTRHFLFVICLMRRLFYLERFHVQQQWTGGIAPCLRPRHSLLIDLVRGASLARSWTSTPTVCIQPGAMFRLFSMKKISQSNQKMSSSIWQTFHDVRKKKAFSSISRKKKNWERKTGATLAVCTRWFIEQRILLIEMCGEWISVRFAALRSIEDRSKRMSN